MWGKRSGGTEIFPRQSRSPILYVTCRETHKVWIEVTSSNSNWSAAKAFFRNSTTGKGMHIASLHHTLGEYGPFELSVCSADVPCSSQPWKSKGDTRWMSVLAHPTRSKVERETQSPFVPPLPAPPLQSLQSPVLGHTHCRC